MFNSESIWLSLTNAALGLAALVCLLAVGRMVIKDVRIRAAARSYSKSEEETHSFTLSSLGITIADGGEPIDENSIIAKRQRPSEDDPPNIIRSDN